MKAPPPRYEANDLFRRLCFIHREIAALDLPEVVEWVEDQLLKTEITTEVQGLDIQDDLRQFHFLRRYRKLSDQQRSSLLQEMEAFEERYEQAA